MAKKKEVLWGPWLLYYVGRAFQLFGLLLVTWAAFMFFGTAQMRPMLAVTGAGAAFFVVGWFLAKDDPGEQAPGGETMTRAWALLAAVLSAASLGAQSVPPRFTLDHERIAAKVIERLDMKEGETFLAPRSPGALRRADPTPALRSHAHRRRPTSA